MRFTPARECMIAFPDSRRTRKLPAFTLLVGPDASGVRLALITGPTGRGQKRNPNRMGLKCLNLV